MSVALAKTAIDANRTVRDVRKLILLGTILGTTLLILFTILYIHGQMHRAKELSYSAEGAVWGLLAFTIVASLFGIATFEFIGRTVSRSLRQQLTEMEQVNLRLRTFVEGTEVIVWEYSPSRAAFTYVSPQAWQFGYPMDNWLARGFLDAHIPEASRKEHWISRDPESLCDQDRFLYRFVPSDGNVRWLEDVVTLAPAPDGSVVIRGVMIDVTARKQLESQLAQAQRLESLGQLAAGIAHEINTPTQYVSDNVRFLQNEFSSLLRVFETYSQLLTGEGESWQSRKRQIEDVQKLVDFNFLRAEIPQAITQSLEGLDRVTTIVRAMKDFSHPGSNVKEPADIAKLISSTLEVCRNRWRYVADVTTDFAENLPAVPCLIAEFNQVMLNLIVNAADAIAERQAQGSPERGLIKISAAVNPDRVEIRIADNGVGIPDANKQRMFEQFFTTKPVGKGTGQGLALSRNVIVEKHGGDLSFVSTEGVGTCFIVQLPLANAALQEVA